MPEKKRPAPKAPAPPAPRPENKPAPPTKPAPAAAAPKAAAPKASAKTDRTNAPKPAARKSRSARALTPRTATVARKRGVAKSAAPPQLSILMVASEAHPYAHTGGLAEVVRALSDGLVRLGHRVTLMLPKYRGIGAAGSQTERATLRLGGRTQDVSFHRVAESTGLTMVFVEAAGLFDRDGLYASAGGDYPDNAWRFAVFNRAALEYARLRGERLSVIHAHDWQTGLVPVFQKMELSNDPVVGGVPAIFTVHNLAFQGVFPSTTLPQIGLGWEVLDMQALEYWGQISYLKGGINFSERITTVSPAYARETLTPELGFGLNGAMARRADELTGILNGIDTERWNPANDAFVNAPFTADDLSGKSAAKQVLLETVGLPADPASRARPVIAMISRLTKQKGLDLFAAAAERLMSLDAAWIMLGSGEREYEDLWRALAARYPDRVSTTIGFEERLAHRIEAGSDLFLMPSRYEPCGLNQLYSLRYGTVPVVHATGGLDDTVRDVPEARANGFKFRDFTPAALVDTVRRALELFRNPKDWKKLQQAGMKDDHSWDVSTREYVKVYEDAARAAAKQEWKSHG